ncbi:DUF6497 family protein [Nioella sediminis]|jgi:hypothetical protein|uniref:DUF6497 family protein n=1 Tax=Nioella sediminis TaxID=1912092 RepID=UPI0008FD4781|nr:DUF6497 family protein [Nioella sediminis]TBX29201.1 hypothetical protein TK43_01730 [Roseovarius sp. JS7-11]
MRALAVILALTALAGCREEALELPSGLAVELAGIVMESQPDGETWLILQVLAPSLAGRRIGAEEMAEDTGVICDTWGLAAAGEADQTPDQIVVQVMSERVERGQPAPGVTQVFAGYRVQDGSCIWEDF